MASSDELARRHASSALHAPDNFSIQCVGPVMAICRRVYWLRHPLGLVHLKWLSNGWCILNGWCASSASRSHLKWLVHHGVHKKYPTSHQLYCSAGAENAVRPIAATVNCGLVRCGSLLRCTSGGLGPYHLVESVQVVQTVQIRCYASRSNSGHP